MWIFCYISLQATDKRKEPLASMCDERARMLQDQFNVSMNYEPYPSHVHSHLNLPPFKGPFCHRSGNNQSMAQLGCVRSIFNIFVKFVGLC